MNGFEAKSLVVLGRQPAISLAELESLYGAEHLRPLGETALLDIPAEEINFKRLGGTVKVARLLTKISGRSWQQAEQYLADKVPEHTRHLPEGKLTLGISAYGLSVKPQEINRTGLMLKKLVRQTGRPVRVVPNKELELNAAQVLNNRLTHRGAWELLLVGSDDHTWLAQTLFVQDIDAYAARDRSRPKRDARVGMLPPKLAQIIINLASPSKPGTILDPFCGTGVLLQEALLMGHGVIGADNDPRMIDYSRQNLTWLKDKFDFTGKLEALEVGDATAYRWKHAIDAVASEIYLGTPFTSPPSARALDKALRTVDGVLEKTLSNLSGQLRSGTRLCLAVPAWKKPGGHFIHLPVLDRLTDIGYNRLSFENASARELIYHRHDQFVARELVVLSRN